MAFNVLPGVFVVTVTWLLHSTLLLGAAALVARFWRNIPPRVSDWLWKTAILLPFVTTALQCGRPHALAIWHWKLASSVGTKTTPATENKISPRSVPRSIPKVTEPKGDWDIEILPDDSPAIAEKSLAQPLNHVANTPPVIVDTVTPEPDPIAMVPVLPEVSREESQVPPGETEREPQPQESTELRTASDSQAGLRWFVSLWVGVVLALGVMGWGRLLWLSLKTRKVLRRARPLSSGPAYDALQKLLVRCNKPMAIELVESDAISIPAAGGLFRRRIVLPRDIERRLDRDQLHALLAHELAHHIRGDVRWLWFGRLTCHMLPWQPLLVFAVRRWQQAAEPLCDDWAIARSINPVMLAKSLMQVAESHLAPPLIGPAAAETHSQLSYRVRRLLENQPPVAQRFHRRWLSAAALLIAGGMMTGTPAIVWPSDEERDPVLTTKPDVKADDGITIRDSRPQDDEKRPRAANDSVSNSPNSPDSVGDLPAEILRELDATTADLNRMVRLLKDQNPDPELHEAADQLKRRLETLRSRYRTNAETEPSPM